MNIYTHVYVIYIFGDPFGGALTRAGNDPRGRSWNTERAGKAETETGCLFIIKAKAKRGLKERLLRPLTHNACVRVSDRYRYRYSNSYRYIYISLCVERWTWQVESTCAGRCSTTSTPMRVSDGYMEPRPSRATRTQIRARTRTLHLTVPSL